ncbi:MAG: DUF308 domain-containing protein [Bacteroidales bacterium]|nr:DUF308 domain-containing protein [Bacteroidales bacterium]
MITFGYKNKFNGPLRALTAIAIGIVMVISRTNALELAVQIIAAFLFASGIVSLIVGYRQRKNGTMGLMGFNGVVDIILGLLLFFFPGFVAGLLIYLIAFVLICFGFFQLLGLGSASRVVKLGLWSYVLPFLVLAAGIFLMTKPSFLGEAIGVVAGAALIVYGVSELFSSWKMRKAIDEYEIRQTNTQGQAVQDDTTVTVVKDVDYEKVEEQ